MKKRDIFPEPEISDYDTGYTCGDLVRRLSELPADLQVRFDYMYNVKGAQVVIVDETPKYILLY